ncbi:signal recognition particle-docking protein FtsY [Corynebacterium phoceense]|uniref:signal recognition particle-docking protein FtsY n=1 Tax=Corynebacterium phoceense TaxID=1686286 RepID=UPI00211C8618|nr:signal recognition particle-docking protein FtsY [Corynebacterium phoceense]MCQ9340271.1 signal recognition particle-docking protein FtsY [Corynebacterium phoceense]
MNTTLTVVIVVALLLLIILGVIIGGKKRGEAKKVSFEKPAEIEEKQLTQEQKSGNYQAQGGFNFTQVGPAKEPVTPASNPSAQPGSAEPSATAMANEQLRGENPKTESKKPEPVKSEPAAPVQDSKVVEETKPEPVKSEPTVPVQEPEAEKPAAGAAAAGAAGAAAAAAVGAAATENVEAEEAAAKADAAAETTRDEVEEESVTEESPVFDEVAEDTDDADTADAVDDIEDDADLERTQEAAAAAEAQTASAAEAREVTEVPEEPTSETASEDTELVETPAQPMEDIAPAAGRLGKLRGRLSRSQNAIGQGLMGILSAGDLDDDAWEEIEDTLIMADLGTKATMKVTESLREKIAERGVNSEAEAREMLRESLIEVGHPEMDRSIKAMPNEGKPAVIMVVGVNGTGKTTTTGKLARVLVAMGHRVLLGAADTFRAAAADQLETWGRRVGADTVRGKEGADPASVAFDAVAKGVEQGVDVVLIDTAGRLHTSTDLMDQLGKVKRVVQKKAEVDEVLMVIDSTVGQNGLVQARVFREIVDITGVVLTKLDGTAKGGIVFQVQEELGVPVKLVGLGEGADDLAPFEIEGFVDALLGDKK